MKKNEIIIFSFLLILFFIGVLYSTKNVNDDNNTSMSSFSAGINGTKAFYTLLEKLNYNVIRSKKRYKNMPDDVDLLISSRPVMIIIPNEIENLISWVKQGNTLILINPSIFSFKSYIDYSTEKQKIGKGYVYHFSSPDIITNYGMQNPKNAMKLLDIISKHHEKNKKIAFDEYYQGYREDELIPIKLGFHIKLGLFIILLAIAITIYSNAVRFGEIRIIPDSSNKRSSYEYIKAISNLYQKTHSVSIAVENIYLEFIGKLCKKFGCSNFSDIDSIYSKIKQTDYNTAERFRKIAQKSTIIIQQSTGSENDLLYLAREINNLERKLNIADK